MNTVSKFATDSKIILVSFLVAAIVVFYVAVGAWINLNNRFIGVEEYASSTRLLTSLDKLRVYELSFSNDYNEQVIEEFNQEAEQEPRKRVSHHVSALRPRQRNLVAFWQRNEASRCKHRTVSLSVLHVPLRLEFLDGFL